MSGFWFYKMLQRKKLHDILSCFLQRENFSLGVKETTKYLFGKIEKHQNGTNKPKTNEDL